MQMDTQVGITKNVPEYSQSNTLKIPFFIRTFLHMKGLFLGKNTFELKSKTTWEQKLTITKT